MMVLSVCPRKMRCRSRTASIVSILSIPSILSIASIASIAESRTCLTSFFFRILTNLCIVCSSLPSLSYKISLSLSLSLKFKFENETTKLPCMVPQEIMSRALLLLLLLLLCVVDWCVVRTDNDLVEEGEGERCAVSIVSHEFHMCVMSVSFLILVHAAFKGSLSLFFLPSTLTFSRFLSKALKLL